MYHFADAKAVFDGITEGSVYIIYVSGYEERGKSEKIYTGDAQFIYLII
jgi:hypothetical protein